MQPKSLEGTWGWEVKHDEKIGYHQSEFLFLHYVA